MLFVISALILLLAVAGVTPLSNLNTDEKIERNFLNGLPGVNNQILAVKIDEHCYKQILLSFINCDENLVLDL